MNQRCHILVVDDDDDIREVLCEVLNEDGRFAAKGAPDGVAALRLLRTGYRPHVVLADLSMPHMGGEELKQACHEDPRFTDIPFVVVTANNRAEASRLGVEGILYKPVDLARLFSILQGVCKLPRRRAQPNVPPEYRTQAGRILVVDSDERVARATVRALGGECDVRCEEEANKAARLVDEQWFDLILCDAAALLPGHELWTVFDRRRTEVLGRVVLMHSGEVSDELRALAQSLRAMVVRKPTVPAEVQSLLEETEAFNT